MKLEEATKFLSDLIDQNEAERVRYLLESPWMAKYVDGKIDAYRRALEIILDIER